VRDFVSYDRQFSPVDSGPKPLCWRLRFLLWPIKAEENSHGHSQFDDASRERAAWNAGMTVGTKRPLTQKQIWAVRFFLDHERRIRNRALFAIDTKSSRLRPAQAQAMGCDRRTAD